MLPCADGQDRETVVRRLAAELRGTAERAGVGTILRGDLRTVMPSALAVPYGDVVAVLDAFHRAGIDDVRYTSRPLPPPAADRP